jgi:hypothetical protein
VEDEKPYREFLVPGTFRRVFHTRRAILTEVRIEVVLFELHASLLVHGLVSGKLGSSGSLDDGRVPA